MIHDKRNVLLYGCLVPDVSVVVPAFNPGRFLRFALDSVVAQTLYDWECVVVDDGGGEDISWVRSVDRRIRLVQQENLGVAAARNRGVEETSSPLVAFLDQDDLWHPEKLRAQVAQLVVEPSAPLCSTDFDIVDAHGNRTGPGFHTNFYNYNELLLGDGICVSTTVVRRGPLEQSGGFAEQYRVATDWDLWLRLANNFGRFTRVDRILAHYRLHQTNESRNYEAILREGSEILRVHRAGPQQAAAVEGERRLRRLIGTQAFDEFRATRRLGPLFEALRLAPRYTIRNIASYPIRALGQKWG
jgi:glycosyltransferase involved in cell wall biosynthesis